LTLEAYPPSFGAEVAAFLARLTGTDETGKRRGRYLLAPDGPRRTLRPATVKARLFAIRQAAGIPVQLGVPAEEIRSLRDLVAPLERVGAILEFLAERHAQKNGLPDRAEVRGGQVAQVAETLRQIATYHCKLAGEPLRQIRETARLAGSRKQSGMAPKVRARLHAMVQPRARALILHLPDELMRRARRLAALGRQRDAGRHALWAVALEVLPAVLSAAAGHAAQAPARPTPRPPRPARPLPSRLAAPGAITKNQKPVDWPIPRASAALIGEYLEKFRPAIAAPDNPFLLPGEDGSGQRSANALANALVGLIDELCGVRVTLHMVRHFAAWRYLKEHPGHYEDVRRLLGHRDAATTMGFYVAFETEAVAARFNGMILKEKRQTRAIAAAAFGKPRRAWR